MAKIPLTIDPAYCSTWKFFEGIREFLQNAKDAEDYDGLAMEVEHKPRSKTIAITTKNISIEASTLLLLGKTSKTDADQRGKFGEGFALGCLALVRAGHPVTIDNGHERWKPEISKAEDGPFKDHDLLVMNTRKLPDYRPDFCVEIENVSTEVWNATKKLFLFLEQPAKGTTVKVPEGIVIMDPIYHGHVYSRGIFVMHNDDIEFGYDINNVTLDRDRRMIDEWDLRWKLGNIWQSALKANPELMAPRVYDMAKNGKTEVKGLHHHIDQRLVASLRNEFHKEHGEDTVPVTTMSEARELESLGATVAIVDPTLQQLLQKAGPSVSDVKEKLKGKVQKIWLPSKLSALENEVCTELIEPITRDYAIVDFVDATPCRADSDGKTLLIARSILSAPPRDLIEGIARIEAKRSGATVEGLLVSVLARQWEADHPAEPDLAGTTQQEEAAAAAAT